MKKNSSQINKQEINSLYKNWIEQCENDFKISLAEIFQSSWRVITIKTKQEIGTQKQA